MLIINILQTFFLQKSFVKHTSNIQFVQVLRTISNEKKNENTDTTLGRP